MFYHLLFQTTTSTSAPSFFASQSVYVCISSTEPFQWPSFFICAEPSRYRAKVFLLLLLMCLITLCVDSMSTSQQITCIYNVWAMQCRGPRLPCWSPVAELHCGTNRELAGRQAGSTYRIQPIQERAKRPLWTINNRAPGFVSCLWEHRKRMREHVMKSGRGGGGGGPPLQFLISL